jgi:hypothetical protein
MHALILERNRLVGRRVARAFVAAGARASVVEDPAQASALLGECDVLCADTFDGDYVAEHARARRMRAVLWTAEPLKRSLRYLLEADGLFNHVLGRRDFESPPRLWETLMLARRLGSASSGPPPLAAYLDWGFSMLELDVRATADRDAAVRRTQEFVERLQVPKRFAETIGEVAHELVMNALYDAPVDAAGHAKYAADRKADIRLNDDESPGVRVAADGTRLVIQVRDPFGRLERRHVYDGLARGLVAGELDRAHGGAGFGLVLCHHASSALFFDVVRGRHTEVTAVFELDVNARELRAQAKSLHFWSA